MTTSFLNELQTLDRTESRTRRGRMQAEIPVGKKVKIFLLEKFIAFAYRAANK